MPRPQGVLVDTHIHLFAKDQARFPYAPTGTYQPPPADLDDHKRFVAEAKLDHGVIVHPEPYQDDHSYLEYCFDNEPKPGFFLSEILPMAQIFVHAGYRLSTSNFVLEFIHPRAIAQWLR